MHALKVKPDSTTQTMERNESLLTCIHKLPIANIVGTNTYTLPGVCAELFM